MSCTLFAFMGFLDSMPFYALFYLLFATYLHHVLFGDEIQLKFI